MDNKQPLLITVAPNGARKSKLDHPTLPISPQELADTALQCAESGAAMIHLHVRDADGKHSILPEHYTPALEAVENSVGDRMIIQLTSESAGIYSRHQQEAAIRTLMPAHVSIALRELVPDEYAHDDAAKLFSDLYSAGSLVQYILYDENDILDFQKLVKKGVIPGTRHFVLLVIGRYGIAHGTVSKFKEIIDKKPSSMEWMCCAFGDQELPIMHEAMKLGGHVRVGFENNTQLPSGQTVSHNCVLVDEVVEEANRQQRGLADAAWIRQLQHKLTH